VISSQTRREVALGLKSLLQHKLRSTLTLLGLVFGVASVVAMLAVGEGASEEALAQIRRLGSNNIILNSRMPVGADAQENVRMSIYGLTYEDELRIKETIPGIRRTVPVKALRKEGQLDSRKLDLRILGTTPDWFDLVKRDLIAGRLIDPTDEARRNPVVVLTEHGARRLLAAHSAVNQPIRIDGIVFTVIGIIGNETMAKGASDLEDKEVDAYIPLSLARNRFGDVISRQSSGATLREKVELHQLVLETDSIEAVPQVAAAVEYLLKRFHAAADYEINVPLALLRQAEASKRTFNIVLGSIAGISLLVGGIGIMNIMLATVTERTREIGIRRAIGAQRKQIIRQFLIETVTLSSTGGIIGLILGVIIPLIITRFAGMPTKITPGSLILAFGISVALGIIFGIYPARRASRLDPIEALRHV
jgi:putative ABC transport system permease protein